MRVSWPRAIAAWVVGVLALTIVFHGLLVAALLIEASTHAGADGILATLRGFDVGEIVLVFVFNAILFAVAVFAASPLQVTALWMRCNRTSAPVFATVAGLSLVSSFLSCAVLYALSPLLALFETATVYVVGVVGFYLFHVLTLVVARRWANGRRNPSRRGRAGVPC